SHVNDDRSAEAPGEGKLAAEGLLLDVARRQVPEVVQADLADGDDLGCEASASSSSSASAVSVVASWGCTPTAAQTPSWAAAIPTAALLVARSVPMVTIRPTPAARARSSAAPRAASIPPPTSSSWQWASTHAYP